MHAGIELREGVVGRQPAKLIAAGEVHLPPEIRRDLVQLIQGGHGHFKCRSHHRLVEVHGRWHRDRQVWIRRESEIPVDQERSLAFIHNDQIGGSIAVPVNG